MLKVRPFRHPFAAPSCDNRGRSVAEKMTFQKRHHLKTVQVMPLFRNSGDASDEWIVPNEFSLFGTKIVPNKLNSLGTIFVPNGRGYWMVMESQ